MSQTGQVMKVRLTWMMLWVSPWEARTAMTLRSWCMRTPSALMSRRSTLKPAVVSTIATFYIQETNASVRSHETSKMRPNRLRKRECPKKAGHIRVREDLRCPLWHRCTSETQRSSGPSWRTVGWVPWSSSWRPLGTWRVGFLVEPCFSRRFLFAMQDWDNSAICKI